MQACLLGWFLTVTAFLLSCRVPQFWVRCCTTPCQPWWGGPAGCESSAVQVVDGCGEENCTVAPGGPAFTTGDACQPETFNNCSSCPAAACVFHRTGPTANTLALQETNLCPMK